MKSNTRQVIEQNLGSPLQRVEPVSGGDINQAWRVLSADGCHYFVKTHPKSPPGMYAAEAHGLRWLADTGTVSTPRVIAASPREVGGAEAFLVLEWLESGPRCRGFDERLGRELARLHRRANPRFGLDRDNFIGSLPQSNHWHSNWCEFFWEERLKPQLKRAKSNGFLDSDGWHEAERLRDRLAEWFGDEEPPATLHGDLWGGNLHVGAEGEPVLIDPAAYAGHREMDLGMMHLFGGFSERVFGAYAEEYPLLPGAKERTELTQLYPLLVHLNLFGAGYLAPVRRIFARYG